MMQRTMEGPRRSDVSPAWSAPAWAHAALWWALLWAVLCAITRVPGIPYNVRELREGVGWNLGLVAMAGLTSGAAPAWLGRNHVRADARRLWPLYLMFVGALVWFLLHASVPIEAMDDIVGTPILHWWWYTESLGRFVGLFVLFAAPLALVNAIGHSLIVHGRPRHCLLPIAWTVVLIAVGYVVVVLNACTDNLTELIRGSGSLAGFLSLELAWTNVAFAAVLLACACVLRRPGLTVSVGLSVAATTAAGLLVQAGLEPRLDKYDRTFSALQFLLSPDREHYVTGIALAVRLGIVLVSAVAGLAVVIYPFLIDRRQSQSAVTDRGPQR